MSQPLSRRVLAASVVLALAWSLGGCRKKDKDKDEDAEPVVPVQVEKARVESIRHLVNAEGVLYPIDQASVTSKISAPVKNFYVKRGDHVKAGQLLAQLESRDLAAAVGDARGALDQAQAAYRTTTASTVPNDVTKAQADVQSAREGLDAARRLYENRQKLFQEGALAHKLVDDAKVAYVQAQSTLETTQRTLQSLQSVGREEQVKTAQAQVESARARYQGAEAQLSYAQIRSPLSGVVADRPLYAGEMAASGSAIVTVVDLSRIVLRANVPVKEAALVRVGDPATIAAPEGEAQGKVTVVSAATDPNSTTVEVWIQAPNPGERLRAGVNARATIVAATIPNAVVAPPAALLTSQEGETTVMVVGPDSKAHERKVQVGAREADKVQIVSGLKAGEQVVTVGSNGLADGAKVKVVQPGAKDEDKDEEKGEKKDEKE